MKIVVQSFSFTQKLWRKDQIPAGEFAANPFCVAYRHSRLDDHQRLRIDLHDIVDDCFNTASIETVGGWVIVSRRRDDDVLGLGIGLVSVQCGAQAQRFAGEVILEVFVLDHALARGDDVLIAGILQLRESRPRARDSTSLRHDLPQGLGIAPVTAEQSPKERDGNGDDQDTENYP